MTDQPEDRSEDHYFTADPDAPFTREPFSCEVWGHELELVSAPGVFSRGHLDHATAVLLRELDPPPMGQFLDLGCGYGPIGIAIANRVQAWRHADDDRYARDDEDDDY